MSSFTGSRSRWLVPLITIVVVLGAFAGIAISHEKTAADPSAAMSNDAKVASESTEKHESEAASPERHKRSSKESAARSQKAKPASTGALEPTVFDITAVADSLESAVLAAIADLLGITETEVSALIAEGELFSTAEASGVSKETVVVTAKDAAVAALQEAVAAGTLTSEQATFRSGELVNFLRGILLVGTPSSETSRAGAVRDAEAKSDNRESPRGRFRERRAHRFEAERSRPERFRSRAEHRRADRGSRDHGSR